MLWQDFKKAVHKQTPENLNEPNQYEPRRDTDQFHRTLYLVIFIFKLIKKFGFAGSTCFFYFFNSLHQQDM